MFLVKLNINMRETMRIEIHPSLSIYHLSIHLSISKYGKAKAGEDIGIPLRDLLAPPVETEVTGLMLSWNTTCCWWQPGPWQEEASRREGPADIRR